MSAYLVGLSVVLIVGGVLMIRLLRQIHVLVNSRLTEALDDITALKQALIKERRIGGRP